MSTSDRIVKALAELPPDPRVQQAGYALLQGYRARALLVASRLAYDPAARGEELEAARRQLLDALHRLTAHAAKGGAA